MGRRPKNAPPLQPLAVPAAEIERSEVGDMLEDMEDDGQRSPEARIRRVDPTNRKLALLDVVDAGVVDEPFIRDSYGGGDYQVLLYGTRPDGKYGYLETKRYRVDSSIPFKGSLRERLAAGAVRTIDAPKNGASDDDGDMRFMLKTQMIEMMKDQNESRNATAMMMMNMMKTQSESTSAMLSAMTTMMSAMRSGGGLGEAKELLAPLIAGVMNKKDAMDVLPTLLQLVKPDTNFRDMLGIMREMKETTDIFGPGGGEDDGGPLLRMLEKSMPGLIDILKNESAKTGTPIQQLVRRPAVPPPPSLPPSTPPNPSLSAGQPSAPAPTAAQPTVQDEWTPLEPYVPYLVSFASENRDPYGVVQTVKTLAPGTVMANIRELVAKAEAVSIVLNRFPALQPFPAWTAALLDEFYSDVFGEDDDDDETPETPTADQPSTGASAE